MHRTLIKNAWVFCERRAEICRRLCLEFKTTTLISLYYFIDFGIQLASAQQFVEGELTLPYE